jgi:uncharacterized protein (DUF2147 family)
MPNPSELARVDGCGSCHRCVNAWRPVWERVMVVCSECGDKRCAKAADCRVGCENRDERNER